MSANYDYKKIAKAAFPEYRGRKVRVDWSGTVTLHDLAWGGGTRSEYVAVELATGRQAVPVGDASNPFSAFYRRVEGAKVTLPPGIAVVRHSIFCGHDTGLWVTMPASGTPSDAGRALISELVS